MVVVVCQVVMVRWWCWWPSVCGGCGQMMIEAVMRLLWCGDQVMVVVVW